MISKINIAIGNAVRITELFLYGVVPEWPPIDCCFPYDFWDEWGDPLFSAGQLSFLPQLKQYF
jgi:hypothetical protein